MSSIKTGFTELDKATGGIETGHVYTVASESLYPCGGFLHTLCSNIGEARTLLITTMHRPDCRCVCLRLSFDGIVRYLRLRDYNIPPYRAVFIDYFDLLFNGSTGIDSGVYENAYNTLRKIAREQDIAVVVYSSIKYSPNVVDLKSRLTHPSVQLGYSKGVFFVVYEEDYCLYYYDTAAQNYLRVALTAGNDYRPDTARVFTEKNPPVKSNSPLELYADTGHGTADDWIAEAARRGHKAVGIVVQHSLRSFVPAMTAAAKHMNRFKVFYGVKFCVLPPDGSMDASYHIICYVQNTRGLRTLQKLLALVKNTIACENFFSKDSGNERQPVEYIPETAFWENTDGLLLAWEWWEWGNDDIDIAKQYLAKIDFLLIDGNYLFYGTGLQTPSMLFDIEKKHKQPCCFMADHYEKKLTRPDNHYILDLRPAARSQLIFVRAESYACTQDIARYIVDYHWDVLLNLKKPAIRPPPGYLLFCPV